MLSANTFLHKIQLFVRDEAGATAIEYALVITLVGGAAFGVMTTIGGDIGDIFEAIKANFDELSAA
jgi:Flp pilus assembly pilin Flp